MIGLVDKIGLAASYEQLAEECVELAHACLKEARKLRGENPTPAEKPAIDAKVEEEATDVLLMLDELQITERFDIRKFKEERALSRLSEI